MFIYWYTRNIVYQYGGIDFPILWMMKIAINIKSDYYLLFFFVCWVFVIPYDYYYYIYNMC